jgi:dTDP-L-rhamnose 4-epimerase
VSDFPAYAGNNDLGTAVLLAQMTEAGVDRLVLASSMVVYGEGRWDCKQHGQIAVSPRLQDDLVNGHFEPRCPHCREPMQWGLVEESAPLDPRSAYAATKVAQEHLTSAWQRMTGSQAVALRYHNVFGPGMPRDTPYSGVAAIFRSALEKGQAPRVFEDGGQMRDFVEVSDVARANVAALGLSTPDFHTFNVGSGKPRSISDMATALSQALGGPEPLVTGEFRLGDVRHIVASSERAAGELGFTAQISFEAGVRRFATAPLRGSA